MKSIREQIREECDGMKKLLLEKNRKYGDSAIHPLKVFSKSDNSEQIKARIDDKLARVQNSPSDEDEDIVLDLIGYLILLRISKKNKVRQNEKNRNNK